MSYLIMLPVIFFCTGCLLGRRLNCFVLIPATFATIFFTYAALLESDWCAIAFAAFVNVTTLQAGHLLGALVLTRTSLLPQKKSSVKNAI